MDHQSLPFKITIARDAEELRAIAIHRAAAYARELPEMGAKLLLPESADTPAPGREVLVARSKLDGEIIGSLRIHINQTEPLPIQTCVDLPSPFKDARLLEACRLSITGGLVCRQALFKALMLYANQFSVDYCVVAARPRISVIHRSIGFEELFDGQTVPLSYAAGIEHKVLWLPMDKPTLSGIMRNRKQSMHDFYFETHHGSDIDLSGARLMS